VKQSLYGLLLLLVLALPPVANLLESIMVVHMHMQMPLIVFAGFLMGKFFQLRFPSLFQTWNHNGVPGILLFSIILVYWMIPRTMDDALTMTSVEVFKFISLSLLAGVPLRDSWNKLTSSIKNVVYISFTIIFTGMGWLYIYAPVQLCNNYILVEQITLGWAFITTAICFVIYLLYRTFVDHSAYEN